MSSETQPDADTTDESLLSMFTSFTPITEFPLPDRDELDDFVEDHPQLDGDDDITIDGLYCDYVNEISRNNEWMVFTVDLYGYGDSVYVWNHQLGEGLRIPTSEWQFGNFAEVLSLARNTTEAWNDRDVRVEGEDGCPYCGPADGDLSSSLRASGSMKQKCTECGRSRLIG